MSEAPGCTVLLVDTSGPGARGSMARYADLVTRALQLPDASRPALRRSPLLLRLPRALERRIPVVLRTWLNHLWLLLRGRRRISGENADIVHILDGSYGYLAPARSAATMVATVHDLIPLLRQSGAFGAERGSWLAKWLVARTLAGLQRCGHLLADSTNTAGDVISHAGIDRARLTVAPLALAPEFIAAAQSVPAPGESSALAGKPYVLHIGNSGYYKNRGGVVRVFAAVRREQAARLVLAGAPPEKSLVELIASLSLGDDIEFMTDPDDATLLQLYRNASVLLFPSLYEGFGWPPLEAMACGCPVVCSTAGSLPEVVGDAALTAAAADEDGLARHCLALLQDPGLAHAMAERGRAWVQHFTLERMRSDLLAAYDRALQHG